MTSITKEKWKELEGEMSRGWVSIRFKYKGYDLYITRVNLSESKSALAVYIDDVINHGWGMQSFGSAVENTPTIIDEVWKKCTKAKYSQKQIKDIEKIFGKRRGKKRFPDLYGRYEYFTGIFSKASVLCRQFKKLESLELIKGEA